FASGRSSDLPGTMLNRLRALSAAEHEALVHFYGSFGSDAEAPNAPADLTIAAKTETSLTLTWTDADDNARIARYQIHRDGEKIAETGFNSFTDTGLSANSAYSYDIYAVDGVGNRSINAAGIAGRTAGEPEVVDPNVVRGQNLWTGNGCGNCHGSADSFAARIQEKYNGKKNFDQALAEAIGTNLSGMGLFGALSGQDMADLNAYVQDQVDGGTEPPTPSGIEGVTLLSNAQTLRKAALLLAGRLPTEAEYEQAQDEAGLRQAVKGLMQGEGFVEFIYRTANEWFLTAGMVPMSKDADRIFPGTFPNLVSISPGKTDDRYREDVSREPLELARFIVENDRSWQEMVTADYSLVSERTLANVYQGQALDLGGTVKEGWTPGRYGYAAASHRDKPYPHAGVLSTMSWLERFPTNPTNRNRHRTRILYRQFLGVDIEALGERPSAGDDLGDYPVPLMENPNCTICHTFMDPAAAAFMDFGARLPFRMYGNDSLDETYKGRGYPRHPYHGDTWFRAGDRWYREVFAPGFEGKAMPGGYLGFNEREPDLVGIPRGGWEIVDATFGKNGDVANLFDGHVKTAWYVVRVAHPHRFTLDLGGRKTIAGFRYVPNSGSPVYSFHVREYELQVSDDGENWSTAVRDAWADAAGNDKTAKTVVFPAVDARFARFIVHTSSADGRTRFGEFELLRPG
ncbi:MAG: discoidin domain-containing protein, partial [Planctomycetota bacterium]